MRAARSPLLLNLKLSKTLLLLQLLMAAAAIAHLTLLPIATWPRLLAMALVLAVTARLLWRWLCSGPQTLCYYPASGDWQINGGLRLQPEPSQFVMRSLVILYLRDALGRRLSRVIPHDSLSAEQHRQLRQLLLSSTLSSAHDG
jgi:hypothetical protein